MPQIQFGAEAYENESYGLPPLKLENWFAEATGDRPDWGHRLIPTPGVVSFEDTTETIGRGMFQSDAIASGSIISIYDTKVRRISSGGTATLITGSITNDNMPVEWALSQSEAVICSAKKTYTVTASNVTEFTSVFSSAGASGGIIDVETASNRFLYVEENSGRLFYSRAGDADDIEGFITAEADPDRLIAVLNISGSVLLFGTRVIEVWTTTDSTGVPLRPRQGFILDVGIISTHAKAKIGGVAYWVGHDGTVYAWAGGREQRISAHWMERAIQRLSTADKAKVRVSAHNWNGHKFVHVFIPGEGDYFFDATTNRWHRRKYYRSTESHWGFDYFVEAYGEVFIQRTSVGDVYKLDSTSFVDNNDPVIRIAHALVPVTKTTSINNLIIEGQAGIGLDQESGLGVDPKCMVSLSYDGRSYKDEMIRPIGKYGEWRHRTIFGPLGQAKPPVVLVELSYSDPVGWSVYGASFNEKAD